MISTALKFAACHPPILRGVDCIPSSKTRGPVPPTAPCSREESVSHLIRQEIRKTPVRIVHIGEEVHCKQCATLRRGDNPGFPIWLRSRKLCFAGDTVTCGAKGQVLEDDYARIVHQSGALDWGEVGCHKINKVYLEGTECIKVVSRVLIYGQGRVFNEGIGSYCTTFWDSLSISCLMVDRTTASLPATLFIHMRTREKQFAIVRGIALLLICSG